MTKSIETRLKTLKHVDLSTNKVLDIPCLKHARKQ